MIARYEFLLSLNIRSDLTSSAFDRQLVLFAITRRTGRSECICESRLPPSFGVDTKKEVHAIMTSEVSLDSSYLQRLYWFYYEDIGWK
jgi:hypothetical protein